MSAATRRKRRPAVFLLPLLLVGVAAGVAVGVTRPRPSEELLRVRAAFDASMRHGFETDLAVTLTEPGEADRSTASRGTHEARTERVHLFLPDVLSPTEGELELIGDGRFLFLSIPPGRRADDDKRWVRIEAKAPEVAQGANVGPVPDPLSVLAMVEGAVDPIRDLGATELDGEPARRYSIDIEPKRLREELTQARYAAAQRFGTRNLSGVVWLDKKGRVLRLEVTSRLKDDSRFTAELDVYRYDGPTAIGVPPPSRVLNAATLQEALRIVRG